MAQHNYIIEKIELKMMLTRAFTGRSVRLMARASQSNPLGLLGRKAFFSAEEAAGEAAKTEEKIVDPPTKEEIEQGRKEWGIQYDDECLKFEKEWKEIADKVMSE